MLRCKGLIDNRLRELRYDHTIFVGKDLSYSIIFRKETFRICIVSGNYKSRLSQFLIREHGLSITEGYLIQYLTLDNRKSVIFNFMTILCRM